MSDANTDFRDLLLRMSEAICAGDGAATAACFCPDGSYYDCFYGEFHGHDDIARMVEQFFHRDGKEFVWHLGDVACTGAIGFARYRFGYTARIIGYEGRRVEFDGISHCTLRDGLIGRYDEIFDRGLGLVQLGFPPERIVKALRKHLK
jgi:hypothetical protein